MNTSITLSDSKEKEVSPTWKRISLAWVVILFALGFAGWIGEYLENADILTGSMRYLLQAGVMSGLVVTSIVMFRQKLDQGSPKSIGMGALRNSSLKFLLGIGIIAIPIILSLLATVVLGWGKVQFNTGDGFLTVFLLGALTTFLFEALPEELVFRGYIYSNLNRIYKRGISSLITIALFVFLPVVLVYIQKNLLGMEIYVGGNSQITSTYLITMFFFATFVQYLRIIFKSIWVGIGFHLFFVYINRLIGPSDTSLIQLTEITNETPLQLVFIGTIVVIFLLLLLYPRITGRKIGWNTIED